MIHAASSFQIGQILADTELAYFDHGSNGRCVGQSNIRVVHYNLHIRRNGNAIIWQKLHR